MRDLVQTEGVRLDPQTLRVLTDIEKNGRMVVDAIQDAEDELPGVLDAVEAGYLTALPNEGFVYVCITRKGRRAAGFDTRPSIIERLAFMFRRRRR